jgi:hypothetical protein
MILSQNTVNWTYATLLSRFYKVIEIAAALVITEFFVGATSQRIAAI